jgi:hypothetical protein
MEACDARVRRTDISSLDELRSLLIFAGQLEQAIVDGVVEEAAASR